ncbi:putative methyltransferase NSUN7 isoform X1 [Haliotis rufescens]|uniref:putative methyltransferase NSUN7 isoform X1 n=1 Tax=Haliotis rufescens TaxID=6454 RepID=UPI00201F5CD8|nr:putative methyltransferase NSUN7 isoform X1 [Haliotis rufescens]XP_046329089.2 putative methyltransferase NSUN7 isoform X1 [Haliotis rufescens]XP_046329090.2 putative methyltransferase NSUN7 isoform X1 [Haliotis rufescens]XP_048243555.1 putative methyltransferase NSUN7 isoform X1 [Haliotis rufescens]XP_048243556.1 putative methyltransferase NSUN7 isoform X1 [Haliotis rufescens]XP_048243557.1 putative methyltransferase NSUN7 isoform X1 [Haliotis rufescens]
MPPTAENVTYQQQGYSGNRGLRFEGSGQGNDQILRNGREEFSDSDSQSEHITNMTDNSQSNGYISDESKYRQEFFFKEPTVYSHRMFVRGAKIYSVLKQDPNEGSPYLRRKQLANAPIQPPVADEEFKDEIEKRKTYELAFAALKYQTILEAIAEESSFFSYHPEVKHDQSLVMVMLFDFQTRKFQHRSPFPDEELDEVCLEVERAILDFKIKLNACLARHRIKARAPSIEFLLPEQVRQQEENNKFQMPVYMWVNHHKTNLADVIHRLKEEGHEQVSCSVLDLKEKKFVVDHHCPDMLVFAPDAAQYLHGHPLVTSGHIVMQDKSSCLAPHSVKHLLNEEDDVIHVNMGSGLTTAHLSSLLKGSGSHIYAFGATCDVESYRVHHTFDHLGVRNIRMMSDSFMDVDTDDSRFKNVRVVLVTAECSKSGITNPVEFVISEGEDMKILRDLSLGESNSSRLGEFTSRHNFWLRQAMKMPKVQAIVYVTRSVFEAENDNVVLKAVEYMNMVQNKKAVPFRLVPPVLPFNGEEIENNEGIVGKFMKFKPSPKMNGCFVAVITREPEEVKETARDVIARAAAKGLMGNPPHKGEGAENGRRRRKSPKRIRGTTSAPNSVPAYQKHNISVSSPVSNYINSASRSPTRSSRMLIGARLHASQPRLVSPTSAQKPLKSLVPEYARVVKHPAPFR